MLQFEGGIKYVKITKNYIALLAQNAILYIVKRRKRFER